MHPLIINPWHLAVAALAAGAWVVVSGMLMAATFGYRDMKAAFDAVGLPIPRGTTPLITHTLVRLILGAAVAGLFVIMAPVVSLTRATLLAAGFAWLLATALPYAVMAQWRLFPWTVAAKLCAWNAGEMLIAALIVRLLYRVPAGGVG